MSSRTVVVLAESDSFIAWADNLMLRAPASWGVTRLIVGFPTNPTARQLDELTERSGESNWNLIKFADVASRIMILKADVVILACSGPLVALLTKRLNQRLPSVLLVNAIPGIALPLTKRAIARRTGVHVFIAHSRRERR